MLLVYTHKKSNRLVYTFDFILKEHLKIDYQITTDVNEFRDHPGPKINYSMESFKDKQIDIFPVLLLFQEDVTEHRVLVHEWDGVKILYKVSKGDFPFDLFAATFFMITRYEEYLYAKKDRFGRYDPRNSLAWKNGFLYDPVVNIWLVRFEELLRDRYPELSIKSPTYNFQPTIDVDNAFAYLHKGFLRTSGGLVMNMVKYRFKNFGHRLRVLTGYESDPYDTYSEINRIHDKYNLNPMIFFLLGNYGGFDRAVSPRNSSFIKLIQDYMKCANVGIHTSFSASSNPRHMKEEIEMLDNITGHEVHNNRFHFIKFRMPYSYEHLMKYGITKDFSMGYPSRPGFRTGYAGTVRFFNLRTNQAGNLRLYPFQLMDATLNFYSKYSPREAYEKAVEIIDKVKSVNGTLITVWHNESLSGIDPWKGWEYLYEKVVDYAVSIDT